MVITASILIAGATISLFLLVDYAKVSNIYRTQEIYDGGVTVLAGRKFDIRHYDKVHVEVSSRTNGEFKYMVCTCQTNCDNLTVSYHNTFSGNTSKAMYKVFKLSKLTQYMLTGSEVNFWLIPPDFLINSTLLVHIFTNVTKCDQFFDDPSDVQPIQTLNVSSNTDFKAYYTPKNDSYLCVILLLPEIADYKYMINVTSLKYQNLAYLKNHNLCAVNACHNYTTSNSEKQSIPIPLVRSLKSLSATQPQYTCIHFNITNRIINAVFDVSTTIFGTSKNIEVITPAVVGSVTILLSCVLVMCLCVVCYKL